MERPIEIEEVHIWGMRDGVEVSMKGYVQAGKEIKLFHTFTNEERITICDFGSIVGSKYKNPTKRRGARGGETPEKIGAKPNVVALKPVRRVVLPTSDINISFERHINALLNWKIPISIAHTWLNAFFEGNGPENNGHADGDGVLNLTGIRWMALNALVKKVLEL